MFRDTGGGLDSAWLRITFSFAAGERSYLHDIIRFECQVVLMIQCVRNVKRLNRVNV